ncbi:MAG: TonB-dependent receptor [Asticcacaulis sp.]
MVKLRLLMSVCGASLIASTCGGAAFAQDKAVTATESPAETVIVVTGIRKALADASRIKRTSNGVVDAITAEDIGKFPDANLAESLQRISGVSIDRSNNEGNQVTVRGFGPSFNLVTLNGRQMPNSSSLQSEGVSRSFNFQDLGSEGVSAVEVYKTGKADVTSGGIGATINIKTPSPFDYKGAVAVVSAKAIYDTSTEVGDKVTPEVSALFSNKYLDGKLGLLFVGSYSERNSRKDRVGTQGWVRNRGSAANVDTSAIDTTLNPTKSWWAPWTVDVDNWDTHRERTNMQGVVQFKPADNWKVTADYTMSRLKETTQMHRQSFWFDSPHGKTDANGTMVDINTPNDELNFWSWDYFKQTNNDSVGLNVEWKASDTLTFTMDISDAVSKSNPDGQTAETLADIINPGKKVDIAAHFGGDIPSVTYDDSRLPGGAFNKANMSSDLFQKRGYSMNNDIKQLHLDGKWRNANDGALNTINFGMSQTNYKIDTALSATFSFVNVPLTNLDLTFQPLGSTADQFNGANKLFPQIPFYSAQQFVDIVEANGQYALNPPVLNGVEELTSAAYVSFDFATDFNNMPVNANLGLRYEKTDVTAYSIQQGVTGLNFRHSQELQIIYDGVAAKQTLTGSYSELLPNMDINMSLRDDLVIRGSYSKTIARSSISSMFPATTLTARPGGPYNASQGNPNLLPYASNNFDLSLEWYYKPGSYASIGYFKKYVDNFIGSTVIKGTVNDVNGVPITDPSVTPRAGCPDLSATPNPNCLSQAGDPAVTWDISTVTNLESRQVDGWEAAVQHTFGETGFGVILNATLVNSDASVDPYNFNTVIALTGLSNSANAIAFYEKHGFQARVAYNWRDKFLLALGTEPTYTAAYGQVDLSASYDLSSRYTVFFEGLNVTNATTRRYGRFEAQLIDAEQYGSRYSIGLRAKF